MTTLNPEQVDIDTLKEFVKAHAEDFIGLLDELSDEYLEDRYGRRVRVTDKVVTPDGEPGMVIRLDMGSKRVLIRMDDPKPGHPTRMLMAHRIEVRRGRPRRQLAS